MCVFFVCLVVVTGGVREQSAVGVFFKNEEDEAFNVWRFTSTFFECSRISTARAITYAIVCNIDVGINIFRV